MSLLFDVMVGGNRDKLKPVPDLRQIRILFMEDDGGSPLATPICDELKIAMRRTMKHFETKFGVKPQVGFYY
jgi:hypothetical protein